MQPSLADLAADLAGVIEHLMIAPVAVVGWSAGAIAAAGFAARFPELVAGLLLIAGVGSDA